MQKSILQFANDELIHFTYIKKDGSKRNAFGYLKEEYQTYSNLVVYWDIEAGNYRSFLVDRLLEAHKVGEAFKA